MIWTALSAKASQHDLGFLPEFLDERDERSAAEQFNANYAHGGGWRPRQPSKWKMGDNFRVQFPGEPWLSPLWMTNLRDERIFLYPSAWVTIVQPDGTWEIARMD